MATMNFGRLGSLFGSGKPSEVKQSARVGRFTQEAYAKAGGPTQGLRRVYQAYLDNQKLLKTAPKR